MAARKLPDPSARFSKPDAQHRMRSVPFTSDKAQIAAKSAKIAQLLKEHPHRDISTILKDLHIDPQTFELVARFCHGIDVLLSPENIVSLSCLAHYLGMTEIHCPNNLLKKAFTYFELKILPSWNESLKALKSSQMILQQAASIGLVDACFESLVAKALANPHLVGEPISVFLNDDEEEREKENSYAPIAKRRLFDLDEGQKEELTILHISLYEILIREMIRQLVPVENIVGSICRYAKVWVLSNNNFSSNDLSDYEMNNNKREIIEAIERLLPEETKGLVTCSFLSEMLRSAMVFEANINCKTGFEIRIGKQLENAAVKDLLIPMQGYAEEVEYDVECVRRIMKNFYFNYSRSDILGLITVAELMDGFLAEVAKESGLKPATFLSLAEMSVSASVGTGRNSDGIYRAIDMYITSHKYLTETEREEVCRVLDCYKMSAKAREHAAQNDRLPLRIVVQVLFVGQLNLRDKIVNDFDKVGDEQEKVEMEKMGSKVMELERECLLMRREIEKKEKKSVWKEMKRKFGCYNGNMEEQNWHVKKKKIHPRK